ncbi:MAG TPA: hypothetical protein PKW75_08890 [candidate division Zixibacteria bacterium]|nr:hypothetical protein [candidate division Zixibacteria bacterium]MDD4916612.1 hypothetical protein [candidate division Zixibacteria bacterium]MDM7974125.1 hypothetical protein [candidate division Zixibacteria bacterium]HOD65503.1 hypothetical protein [candidate division Zixibacteria bacterium]HOZ08388.1 hypothetical protein [candidate division Zixibacteria bacterium]
MFVWCSLLFVLGILAFLDSVFNMGMIFRQVNSVFFMLVSLALLVRTTTKMKEKKVESYQDKVFQLERRVRTLEEGRKKLETY